LQIFGSSPRAAITSSAKSSTGEGEVKRTCSIPSIRATARSSWANGTSSCACSPSRGQHAHDLRLLRLGFGRPRADPPLERPDKPEATETLTSLDPAAGLDDVFTTIRSTLAEGPEANARSAGAVACRAILGVLDPSSRVSVPASKTADTTQAPLTSPFSSLLLAFDQGPASAAGGGSIRREQLFALLAGGLRLLLAQSQPTYRTAPVQTQTRSRDGVP
jgi:hypothetical protein